MPHINPSVRNSERTIKLFLAGANLIAYVLLTVATVNTNHIAQPRQGTHTNEQEQPAELKEAERLQQQAEQLQKEGKYDAAIQLAERAVAIREKVLGAEHPAVAVSINYLAVLHYEKGDYRRAEPLLKRVLEIRRKILPPEHQLIAQSLNNLAQVYQEKADYVAAEPLLQRALEIYEKALGPEHREVATALNNLAQLYRKKGDYERAEQLHLRALEIRRKAQSPEELAIAQSLNNLAQVYQDMNDHARAEPLFQQALERRKKVLPSEHYLIAHSLNNLAVLYQERGDFEQAESSYQQALSIYKKALGLESPLVNASLNNLAVLHLLKGDYEQAEILYNQALTGYEKALGSTHPDVATSLVSFAVLYDVKGDIAQAVRLQTRGTDIRENNLALILTTGSEQEKLLYMATLSDDTNITVSLHLRSAPNNMEAARLALTTVLRRKGRVLDAMSDQIGTLRRRLNSQDSALLEQLSATRSQLATLVFKGPGKSDRAQHSAEVANLEARVRQLERAVSARSTEFRAQSQPVTLEQIQKVIPAGAALVEITMYQPFNSKAKKRAEIFSPERYAAYVLRREGAPAWVELGEAAAINKLIATLRTALTEPESGDVKQAARELDERVMHPIRKLLGDTQRVLLSPDGALNLVPFGVLVDERNRYLVETYSITYLTSGRDLLRLQVQSQSRQMPVVMANPSFDQAVRGTASVVAAKPEEGVRRRRSSDFTDGKFPPLPSSAEEAKALSRILPNAKVLTEARATEAAIKEVSGPSILHVATHGFFLPNQGQDAANAHSPPSSRRPEAAHNENPLLRSGLAFAGVNQRQSGGQEDGLLTALEAAGLDLWGTKLVVLSACETGVGDIRNGDGVYGLRRALVLAGTESQVMALWQVSDIVTRELMVKYYKRLKKGKGRTEALREVQLEMIKSKSRNHPFFWASLHQ